MTNLAIESVKLIKENDDSDVIDIKRYCKVEKIPGGLIEDCCVLHGVMVNKDITHSNMRR